jgi:multimeric flavodoxin WrbA
MNKEIKNVLGIVASPRKLGNCEIAVKEISRNIPEKHELRILRIADYDLQLCNGCYRCLFKEQDCVIKDELHEVLGFMAWADAYILAVPTYFLGPNSSLKLLLDRALSFYTIAEKLWLKPSAAVAIAGIEGKEGYTLLAAQSFLKILLSDIKSSSVMYAAFPGEIFTKEDNIAIARCIGAALFGEMQELPGTHCPLCGGDTFRFLGGDKVKCMLCSNSGEINIVNGNIKFGMQKDRHELFLTFDKAMEHKEWLKNMKQRFFDNIKEIKKARDLYRDM